MAVMGSGSIVSRLARHNLIEWLRIVIGPVVLGEGRTIFEGLTCPLTVKRTASRSFAGRNVLLCCEPTP